MVTCKDMEDHFGEVEVGETDTIHGPVDDVIYKLWGMKEYNYVMATGGHLMADDTRKETVIRWKENGEDRVKKFKYKLPFDWHFRYRHAVDNQNNLRHALISIEDKYMTDWWECQVFAFILAISEVNAFFILYYFVYCGLRWEGMPTLLDFFGSWHGNLLTIYRLDNGRGGGEFLSYFIHRLMTALRRARKYHNRRWICTSQNSYQQYRCSFQCRKKIWTYCVFNQGVWIYSDCNVQHVLIASSYD